MPAMQARHSEQTGHEAHRLLVAQKSGAGTDDQTNF